MMRGQIIITCVAVAVLLPILSTILPRVSSCRVTDPTTTTDLDVRRESRTTKNISTTTYFGCNEVNPNVGDFYPEVPLPFPVLVVGLPKTGTSSITEFFKSAGYRTNHWLCEKGKYLPNPGACATCIENALRAENPTPLSACGDYQVWSQMDTTKPDLGECGMPQIDYLGELHREYPYATFILNLRNVSNWVTSVTNWTSPSNRGTLAERYVRCPSVALNSTSISAMESFYCQHVERIRSFVKQHPTHALVEVDIEDDSTGARMASLFATNASNWRVTNAGHYRTGKQNE